MMTRSLEDVSIQAVLFDNDGTLVDTEKLISTSFHHTVKTVLGHDIDDEILMAGVGTPLRTQMEKLNPAHADELLRVYREHNHRIHDEWIKAFDGVGTALAQLKKDGFALGVVTSKRHVLAEHGLDLLGLTQYFDVIIGSEDSDRHKPDPQPLLIAASTLGIHPSACIYVGDSPYDLQSARSAGMYSIAALWGMFSREKLAECEPDSYAMDMSQVVSITEGLRGR